MNGLACILSLEQFYDNTNQFMGLVLYFAKESFGSICWLGKYIYFTMTLLDSLWLLRFELNSPTAWHALLVQFISVYCPLNFQTNRKCQFHINVQKLWGWVGLLCVTEKICDDNTIIPLRLKQVMQKSLLC